MQAIVNNNVSVSVLRHECSVLTEGVNRDIQELSVLFFAITPQI